MMKSNQKLWTVLGMITILAMILSACATQTPEVIEKVTTVEVEKVVTQEVVKTVEVEKQVEVTVMPTAGPQMGPAYNADVSGDIEFWHFWASPVRRNAVRRVIAICKQHLPNINVTDTVKPFGDIWTANIAAVAAGTGMPDVIVADRPTIPRDANDGVYQSLQEFADRDGITRDQYYDWAWDQASLDGEVYGIPHETDVSVLFWNKGMFEAAGLDPNKPPETWDELIEYADKLDVKNADGTYSRIAFFPLWSRGLDVWQYNNDAEMIADDGTVKINNPNMVETLQWVKDWVDRYGGWQAIKNFEAKYGASPNDLFMGGGVAMRVDIFGYNSFLEFYRPRWDSNGDGAVDGTDARIDWGIGLLPHAADAQTGTWSGGFALSIPTGVENTDAAWEWIKCATSAEAQASWARDTQAQPTNIEAANDPVLTGVPLWQVVGEALAVSTGGNILGPYPNWSEQLTQRLEKVWNGELTPQAALDEAQAAVEEAIQ